MAFFLGSGRVVPAITTHVINNQSKSGIIPSTQSQIIKPDIGYTGLSQVTVEAIPDIYVLPSGTYTVTNSGIYNISTYASVKVNSMSNPTWTTPSLNSSTAKLIYSATIYSGFNSTVQSFSSSYTLPTVSGSTIIPSDTSQIAVESYKWTTGSIIVDAIPNTISIYKKIYEKTINDDELNNYLTDKTTIGSYTFIACSSLSSSIYGNNIISIETYAFTYCSNLKNVSFPNASIVPSYIFSSCAQLISATFNNASVIYNGAFYNCPHLTNINAPNVSMIYNGAFYYCIILSNINFPNLTSINGGAFSYCYSLSYVSFSLLSLINGGYTFYQCTNLSYINLPILEKINGANTFAYCKNLKSINLPRCSFLSGYTFTQCSSLQTISLPAMVSFFAQQHFAYCYNLTSLYLMNSVVATLSNSNTFTSTPIGGYSTSTGTFGSIYVPASLLTAYQTATNWSYFSSRFVGI